MVALVTALVAILSGGTSRPPPAPRDVLALARACVSEATWTSGDDCAAIAIVLARRPFGGIHRAALRYMPRTMGTRPPRRARQAWVAGLRLDARQPRAWPRSGPPWRRFRQRWRDRIAEARRILRDHLDPCTEPPDHWGGAMDRARARRLGFVPVDCGNTVNYFYRLRR